MAVRLRATLFVASAILVTGCGESFSMTGDTADSTGPTTSIGGGGTGGSTAGSGGASSGTSSTAGTGGATCDSVDHDDDGYSACDGDCDDTLDFVHPGAPELCGDGIDEDCDGASDAEPPCSGLGTFVSEAHGSNGASGTMIDPVATIAEGVQRAQQIGVPTIIVVSAGQYSEKVALGGGMSLLGGYDPDDWFTRDPLIHLTTLQSTAVEGLAIKGAVTPIFVDGFTIESPIVASGNLSSAAVNIDGGNVTLSSNVIKAGPVNAGIGASVGVRITAAQPASGEIALISNTISSGTAVTGPSYGVAIDAPSLDVTLFANQIAARKGADSVALFIAEATSVSAAANTLQSGTATGSNNGASASLGVWAKEGSLFLAANYINTDQVSSPPKCFTPNAWCGGVRISTSAAVVTNNVIFGSSSEWSAAVHLVEDHESLAGVVVSSNLLLASGLLGIESNSAAVVLGSPRIDAQSTAVGRFRNNIFFGGLASKNFGFWEERTVGESCDPAALDHNLFYFSASGVLYSDWDGAAASNLTQLAQLPGDGENLFEDPKLTGTHLKPESPCRNQGTDTDAPTTDLDGESRPTEGAFDIGPDEFQQ